MNNSDLILDIGRYANSLESIDECEDRLQIDLDILVDVAKEVRSYIKPGLYRDRFSFLVKTTDQACKDYSEVLNYEIDDLLSQTVSIMFAMVFRKSLTELAENKIGVSQYE